MSLNKKLLLPIVLIAAIVMVLPLVVQGFYSYFKADAVIASEEKATAPKHTISVQGNGEIQVKPDVVYAFIAVLSEAQTAQEAQAANAKAFEALNKVLYEQYKIDKKDVKTTGFHVQPQYNYSENRKPEITGYTAEQTVQVTYRDLDGIGALLDDVSAAGVNRINQIQFGTEKEEQYKLEALKAAMDNAEAKANVLAEKADATIKGVLHISESGTNSSPIHYAGYDMMAKSESMSGGSTSIAAGELTITANVSVQYEF